MSRATLLALAMRARIRIGHPCRGEGICGKCTVAILAGGEFLEPPEARERSTLAHVGAAPNERLACLARVRPGGVLLLRVGGGTYPLPTGAVR